jgi:hypothetical protein
LAALIALVVFEPFKSEPALEPKLTALVAADVQRISISKPGYETIVLEKSGPQWHIVAPITAPANATRIDNILAVIGAESEAQYPRSGADLAQLQLDKPRFQLSLNGLELLFGDTQPLSQNRYVLSGDTVHLINDRYSYLLQGVAADFVDTRLLPDDVSLEAISLPGMMLRKEQGRWQIVGAASQPSADRIHALVDAWRFARAVKVSAMTDARSGAPVSLTIADGKSIQFMLVQTDTEDLFQRRDLGLQYHVTKDNAQSMLGLSSAQPPRGP